MARQSTTPVTFNRSVRKDRVARMSSARAGVVVPVTYIPLLPGDTCSGRVGVDIQLAEMPKPLLNAVAANFQAWFVPKSALPKFSGRDELIASMAGTTIKALGQADRSPPAYYTMLTAANTNLAMSGGICKALGLHTPANATMNSDLLDSFVAVWNFRAAAHSNKLTPRKYCAESVAEAAALPPAFWPSSRFASVVPDYERALVVGALDLDVLSGQLSVRAKTSTAVTANNVNVAIGLSGATGQRTVHTWQSGVQDATNKLYAEMAGTTVGISLADFDKAKLTQSFAKLRTAYAGSKMDGYRNDDALTALLMMGVEVPADDFRRPWLLDQARVAVGFSERFATDGASLDASVTQGRASATLRLNVPAQDVGGVVIVTCEVLPERIDERMQDEWLLFDAFDDLPNALRDVQRVEPVDMVLNRRVDAKHTTPNGLYGYEPMNNRWNRDFTHLGGDFYQATPGAGWTENRSNIWQCEIVDPTFSATHYLAPQPFPHDVFSNTAGSAFEIVARHDVSIVGLTQIGDVLVEDNDEYADVVAEQV